MSETLDQTMDEAALGQALDQALDDALDQATVRDPGKGSPFRSDTWLNGEVVPGYFPPSGRFPVT
ncbi:hypothetical protein ACWD0J_00130 [Streptomyces sp. NPDC003011]